MGVNDFIKIGNRIKRLRLEKGLSQREVAKALELPYSTYSNYENNNREPSADMLYNIATALGVTTDYLLGFTDDPQTRLVAPEDWLGTPEVPRGMVRSFRCDMSGVTSEQVHKIENYDTAMELLRVAKRATATQDKAPTEESAGEGDTHAEGTQE